SGSYTIVWGGFNLSATSTASFQNTANSTTAFQVQDASSNSLFTVDSTNYKITLGPSSTTKPVLLVLGNKTATGDPTEADGAMYYNSALTAFRCGRNGFWSNCAINEIDHSYNF